MNATVLSELTPDVQARVLNQISETEGVAPTALAVIKPKNQLASLEQARCMFAGSRASATETAPKTSNVKSPVFVRAFDRFQSKREGTRLFLP